MDAVTGNKQWLTVDRWNDGSVDGMVERAVGVLMTSGALLMVLCHWPVMINCSYGMHHITCSKYFNVPVSLAVTSQMA